MKIQYSSVCDIGRERKINQDALYIDTGCNWGIFLVADGMGGHSEGERASKAIVTMFRKWIAAVRNQLAGLEWDVLISQIRDTLSEANTKIWRETPEDQICGSTVVILFFREKEQALITAGDSRCYMLEKKGFKKKFRQLTRDEVYREKNINYGKLMNAIGTNASLRCMVQSDIIEKKRVFLLCTDGVYKYCDASFLEKNMKKAYKGETEQIMENLKAEIYRNGAGDNFSAILVRILYD